MVRKPGSKHSATSSRVIARRNDWNSIRVLHQGPRLQAASRGRIHVDRIGTESGGGGLSTTLRDLARFGETIRNHGRFNGRQIVPSQVVEDIARGGDPAKFKPAGYTTLPGASYRNQWWVTHNAHGAYMARGVHGQGIYIDPKAEMVIARYASHPAAGNAANDPVTLPAYMALAKDLMPTLTGWKRAARPSYR